jgi:hypothetical protein
MGNISFRFISPINTSMLFMFLLLQSEKKYDIMKSFLSWDVTPCSTLNVNDISEEHVSSINRVEE